MRGRVTRTAAGWLPAILQSETTAERSNFFPISSASTWRLIFIDAVRGKSLSQTTYPPTRLKSGRRRLRVEISLMSGLSKLLILFEAKDEYQAIAA